MPALSLRGSLAAALAAADAEEREKKVASKLNKYRQTVVTGKGLVERDHRDRAERLQGAQQPAPAKAIVEARAPELAQEEKRLIARCKMWCTSDFEALRMLGRGGYGVVHLVRQAGTGEIYALKQMQKRAYRKKNSRDRAQDERALLAESRSRWFVKLFATFQDADYVYMLMEFLQGGDLVTHIYDRRDRGMSLQETCFYMAELIEAVDTVHRHGFVHRDIKPENIVFGADGHLKLLDFGLCSAGERGQAAPASPLPPPPFDESLGAGSAGGGGGPTPPGRDGSCALVGTPMYCAPEMYEEKKEKMTFQRMRMVVKSPEPLVAEQLKAHEALISRSAALLITGLVCSVGSRLSAEQCREEPFFAGIDFGNLHLMQPPWDLRVDSPADDRFCDASYSKSSLALPTPMEGDLAHRDKNLDWAHYEFDARAH